MRAAVFVFSFRVGGERRGTAAKHTHTRTDGVRCVGGCNWTETTCRLITVQHVIFLLFAICLFYVSIILSFHSLLFSVLLVFEHPLTLQSSQPDSSASQSASPCSRSSFFNQLLPVVKCSSKIKQKPCSRFFTPRFSLINGQERRNWCMLGSVHDNLWP